MTCSERTVERGKETKCDWKDSEAQGSIRYTMKNVCYQYESSSSIGVQRIPIELDTK